MKRLKLTKVIASTLIVASVLALNPIGASAEWKQDKSSNWWYSEGNSWATGWRQIDGKWYHFNERGYMAHDTTIDGYYLDSSGAWSTDTLDEEGRYKHGTIITLSGTLRKHYWIHPMNGKIDYYVLELDTPANFNVFSNGERYIYDRVNEIQISSKDSSENLDKQVDQHVNVKGTITGGAGTVYYREPATMFDWTFD